MTRAVASFWVSGWRTARKYHFGTVCLGITFVASVVILANVSNMRVQVHRSFLSFSYSNETLHAVCAELNQKMASQQQQQQQQGKAPSSPPVNTTAAVSAPTGSILPPGSIGGTAVTFTDLKDDETTLEAVVCDLTQFKKGLPVAGAVKNRGFDDQCPEKPATLFGRFNPSMMPMTMEEMASMFPVVAKGGHYTPRFCRPIERTLIIIPYRNRCSHLYTLLPVLISMLIRQNIDFTIYVIEQITPGKFNKGVLFNSGVLEALKRDKFNCIVLHDVDLIPVNDLNFYRCNQTGPIHLSPIVSKYNFKELYSGLFGGVVCFTREQFQKINGASNVFFGWGAEDDDLRNRAFFKNLTLLRRKDDVGVYYMVKHKYEEGWERNPDRLKIFAAGKSRQDMDGLNSVKYKASNVIEYPMFTWVGIDFNKEELLKSIPPKMLKGKVGQSNFYDKANFTYV